MARQTVELNFLQLISKSSELLSEKGILSVIIPSEAGHDFVRIAHENQLFLIRKVNIKGIENSKVKRLVLEFSLNEKEVEESEFIIEKSPREYWTNILNSPRSFMSLKKLEIRFWKLVFSESFNFYSNNSDVSNTETFPSSHLIASPGKF